LEVLDCAIVHRFHCDDGTPPATLLSGSAYDVAGAQAHTSRILRIEARD
jgi:hypothetical protein